MRTALTRIRQKAQDEPKQTFTSLYHHVTNVDNLRQSFKALKSGKAKGVDGVTKQKYAENLEENLESLSERLKAMSYKTQAKRRTYIPKPGSKKQRPLAIACVEDKIVEQAVKTVLEAIYEADFENSSYGYRPGRSQHECLDDLGRTIQQGKVNYVVEADIRSFFDQVNHEWMMKFLEHRIADQRLLRLIKRLLIGGILEDGLVKASTEGTPQGSILSPLLSNIYLHYVLDLWFRVRIKEPGRGEAHYFRFADDFIACFQFKDEADQFMDRLKDRLEGFNLQLAEEKTQCLRAGRFARETEQKRGRKPKEFTFLGFTHYCGKTREGYFKLKRKTSRKSFQAALRAFTEWVKTARVYLTKGQMLQAARRKVIGHLQYFAIMDNSAKCRCFLYHCKWILRKWINRKSQRKAYKKVADFLAALEHIDWPEVRIYRQLNPCRR